MLWPNSDSETDIDIQSFPMGLPQFIYQGIYQAPEDPVPGGLDLLKNSKLRWFHLPMNNVRLILGIGYTLTLFRSTGLK